MDFDLKNLHHAYLIEGNVETASRNLLQKISSICEVSASNPDFFQFDFETLKIDDAKNIKSMARQKPYQDLTKRIFIISTKNFLPASQNALLKIFEEPQKRTHFFIIIPSTEGIIPTILSRVYLIKEKKNISETKKVETLKFIKSNKKEKINFLKDFAKKSKKSEVKEFLNSLEAELSKEFIKNKKAIKRIIKVRRSIQLPGASTKTLLESVALCID